MAYELATYSDGIAALADIKTILTATAADPFPATFQSFSEVVGTDLNGAPIRAGLPRVVWHWDWLYRSDYDDLAAFIGDVFIETNQTDGTAAQYQAVLGIPKEPEQMDGGRCGPADAEFTMLVVQTP